MKLIHIVLGIGIIAASLATLVAAFLPNVQDELFDNLSSTTVGLLIIQVVVGFFMFTSQETELNFFHLALPIASGAALLGARAAHGDRRKQLVALSAFVVFAGAIFAYVSGLAAARSN